MKTIRTAFLPVMVMLFCVPTFDQAASASKAKYYALSAEEIVEYVHSSKKRKLVFIYTSWCPHCRKDFPKLIEAERRNPGTVFAISVDEQDKDLKRYLKEYESISFSPILLKGKDKHKVETLLGATPRRGIPYFILIDEKNRVEASMSMYVEEAIGFLDGK